MELPSRPAALEEVVGQIVPSILLLFLGVKHIYASRVLNKPEQLARAQGTEEEENGEIVCDWETFLSISLAKCLLSVPLRLLYVNYLIYI